MDMSEHVNLGASADAQVIVPGQSLVEGFKPKGFFVAQGFDRQGNLVWEDQFGNLVVDEGATQYLEVLWRGAAYTASHFMGLTNADPVPAAGDTLATHPGWTEFSSYTGNRQAMTFGAAASAKSISTTAPSVFAITGAGTVGGGFPCTVATGTTGILISVGAFASGNKPVDNGYTVNVSYTATS